MNLLNKIKNWKEKKSIEKKSRIRLTIIKNIYKQLLKNQKEIMQLKELELKKEKLIDEIIIIRDMDMIEIAPELSNKELKESLMEEKLDNVIEIFNDILKELKKELGGEL